MGDSKVEGDERIPLPPTQNRINKTAIIKNRNQYIQPPFHDVEYHKKTVTLLRELQNIIEKGYDTHLQVSEEDIDANRYLNGRRNFKTLAISSISFVSARFILKSLPRFQQAYNLPVSFLVASALAAMTYFSKPPLSHLDMFLSLKTPFGEYARNRALEVFPTNSYWNYKYNNVPLPSSSYPEKLNISNEVVVQHGDVTDYSTENYYNKNDYNSKPSDYVPSTPYYDYNGNYHGPPEYNLPTPQTDIPMFRSRYDDDPNYGIIDPASSQIDTEDPFEQLNQKRRAKILDRAATSRSEYSKDYDSSSRPTRDFD